MVYTYDYRHHALSPLLMAALVWHHPLLPGCFYATASLTSRGLRAQRVSASADPKQESAVPRPLQRLQVVVIRLNTLIAIFIIRREIRDRHVVH